MQRDQNYVGRYISITNSDGSGSEWDKKQREMRRSINNIQEDLKEKNLGVNDGGQNKVGRKTYQKY